MRRDQPSVAATKTRHCCSPFASDGASERMITIPGFGDHVRADWLITINGMRSVVIDAQGRPICSEMWPGNTADSRVLVPAIERLRSRFGTGRPPGGSPRRAV